MLHSVLAVLIGFAVMAALVMVATAVAVRLVLHESPAAMRSTTGARVTPAYLAVNLAVSAVAALAGGYVTAAIAGHSRVSHGAALAMVMIVMSFLSMRTAGTAQPRWYQLTLAAAMPVLAVGGAALCGVVAA